MAAEARVQWNQLQNSQQAACWYLNFTLSPLLLQSEEILFLKPQYPHIAAAPIWGGWGAAVATESPLERGKGSLFALIASCFPRKPGKKSGELWWGSRYHDKFGVLSSPGQWHYKDSRTCRSIPGVPSEHMRTVCYFPSLVPFLPTTL